MREVSLSCPQCGRRSYLQVDAWSGLPDSELTDAICARCRWVERASGSWQALVFWLFALVCVVVGVLEALTLH